MFDNHDGGVWRVNANLDHCCCDQNFYIAAGKGTHDQIFFIGFQAAMNKADAIAEHRPAFTIGAITRVQTCSLTGPTWLRGVDFSDQLNYWNHGYPAVMITDTSFMRNANYHTAKDTPDTLDYDRMAQVVLGVWSVVKGHSH